MQKQPEKNSISTVIVSAIVSMLVLSGITYFAISYLIPHQAISTEILYTVLIRLLPMLIGLIMVLIAIIMYPPRIPTETDKADELELDSYTAPLYNLPQEEESLFLGRPQMPVREPEEIILSTEREVHPVAQLKITPFSGRTSFTPFDQREIPVKLEPVKYPTTTMEMPSWEEPLPLEALEIEVPVSVSKDPLERLTRAVLFSEYPYTIIPGTAIAQLLEPIEESELAAGETLTLLEDSFTNRFEVEFSSAQEMGYEFTLAIISIPTTTESQAVNASVVQNLFNKIGLVSFFYLTEENTVSAILPFHGFAQSRRYFASLLDNLRKNDPLSSIKIGFSTLRSRDISAEELLREATIAAEQAASREGYSVIAYDVELEA